MRDAITCIYSFIVDEGSRFPYQAWHLAHSLMRHCGATPRDIHIQCTDRADRHARALFERAGFVVHSLERFGDKTYCNKLKQLDNLADKQFDIAVLLDTDMLAVSDLRPFLSTQAITAKIVDGPNPPLPALIEIARRAEITPGEICFSDDAKGVTFEGNCNGGMYAIPRRFAAALSRAWQHWALWLLDNMEPLRAVGAEAHVDQVSFWLALQSTGFRFKRASSNANYFVHYDAPRSYMAHTKPIALLHYHNSTLGVTGAIEPPPLAASVARSAITAANAEMANAFNNALFWNYRYEQSPDRGSGIGSRGDNLIFKRRLLKEHGLASAKSVLDVGCGDMEVVREFQLQNYTGLDLSPVAIERGKTIFPHGTFALGLPDTTPPAELVLCFEVLIHQHAKEDYDALIEFITSRTARTLIVSGYRDDTDAIRANPMVFFHEPLRFSLERTGCFRSIQEIGSHTDVVILRCDV